MHRNNLFSRNIKNRLFKIAVLSISVAAVVPLVLILFFIASKGLSSINLNFFISGAKPTGEVGGGILNAIVGTSLLMLVSCAVSIPLGILIGIYLAEKGEARLASSIRWSVDLVQGIPSIVLGLVGYAWFVLPIARLTGAKITFSILAGGLTLSIIMLPVVIKSTEETMRLIPFHLKEASIALGVPYYKTILSVILPASLNGVMTGILLGIARISGETAPLLFTVFGNYYFNADLTKPSDSLPLLIYNYATSPYKDLQEIAWGASFVLVSFVLVLNIVSRLAVRKWKIQF